MGEFDDMVAMDKIINVERDVKVHIEDRKSSRRFFVFLWLLYAIVYMTKNCYNGAMASIVSEGILTKSQTGFITSMFYVVYTPLQIVGGLASDRFSPQRIIKFGLLGGAIANTIIFFNQSYYVMLAAWIFNGMVQFGIWPSLFKIISTQLVRSDRKAMTFFISFASTSGLVFSYLVAAIVSNWKYNFAISAILLLVFAVTLHLLDRIISPKMKWDKAEPIPENSENAANRPKTDKSLFKLFSESGFFFLLIGVVIAIVVSQSRTSLAPIMLVENYNNVSPSMGNILNIVLIVSGILGTIIAGKICFSVKNELFAMVVVYAIMIPFLMVCSLIGSAPVPVIVAALSVVACLESIATLNRSYYNMSFVKYGKSGTAAGILNAGASFSFVIAGYVVPRIVEKYSWNAMVKLWPVMIAVTLITISLAVKRYKRFKENIV